VAGGGIAHLRERGVEVTVGVRRADAERLNRPFFTRITRRRPFVIMKAAVSLDGRIAAARVCGLHSPDAPRIVSSSASAPKSMPLRRI
jgi:hypothetical protein